MPHFGFWNVAVTGKPLETAHSCIQVCDERIRPGRYQVQMSVPTVPVGTADESPRALVAAKLANMKLGDNRGAHRPAEGSANLQTLNSEKVSQTAAAGLLNVSPRTVAEVEGLVPAAGGHGGKRRGEGFQERNTHLNGKPSDGSRERRIAQLKKANRGDLAQAVIDRRISARAASIEAGLIKVKSPLDVALAAYRRLSPEDREKFEQSAEAKAAEVERAMKQVDPEAEEFVGPGAPKGNQNAVKDDGETINQNLINCSSTPRDHPNNTPGILRRLARAASGQKSRGVVPSPERQAQCQELLPC